MCAGLWSRNLVDYTAMHPCYHMYVVTKPEGVPRTVPIIRDTNGLLYAREWSGGFCIGGFELDAKLCFVN